ncbi:MULTISPECIES: IS3 family transposase [Acidithiobacillus]|uniref:IS3 family transposase n=8 Tax=Acidithiobacillus TaxID=119977 RepID=A0A845UMJ3_9PROT|nr:IS3 family transposase [Acidithiobacillus ferrooxidans]NDU42572.1 IS3 family transposase [Acidithiobacillus ferrianus]MBU2818318.1 IS3 family transposase [Acidithiobacillus ferrooxidans]MCR1341926.1 IS3 family transposase [Acidithiobacillus ferrooxidans]NDU42818.1 IS3 family transposase [Acidithiobacillus ferrianus]NDU43122.1 IS3 family transposase [Acidithiobacillus ferrianus]
MRKSRFSEEKMVSILREADREPVGEVAKRHGISEQTIYNWRRHFGSMDTADVKKLRELEQENARLKKMLADRDLEIDVMKEIAAKKLVSAQARREQVRFAVGRGLSQRRACALLSVARSALNYTSKMLEKDVPALGAMNVLSAQYPRFGYRRVHVFMERQGFQMGHGRAWRLWSKGNLQVPRKRPRKRVVGSRPRPCIPRGPGQVWAYDFVHDACANGQKIKCLTVIDEFTKISLAIDVAGSIRSGRVVEVLSQLVSVHGAPRYVRSDNGPEFVSRAILRWARSENIDLALSDPGKPWQNGVDESFNGKFRDECLSLEWFRNRTEAKVVIEQWRRHYNEVRPHSSLGYRTPNEFVQQGCSTVKQGAVVQE